MPVGSIPVNGLWGAWRGRGHEGAASMVTGGGYSDGWDTRGEGHYPAALELAAVHGCRRSVG